MSRLRSKRMKWDADFPDLPDFIGCGFDRHPRPIFEGERR
jgi:hypothetical protein